MKDHIYRPRRLLSIFGTACLAEREKKLLATTTAAVAVAATIAAPTSADAQLIDEALS